MFNYFKEGNKFSWELQTPFWTIFQKYFLVIKFNDEVIDRVRVRKIKDFVYSKNIIIEDKTYTIKFEGNKKKLQFFLDDKLCFVNEFRFINDLTKSKSTREFSAFSAVSFIFIILLVFALELIIKIGIFPLNKPSEIEMNDLTGKAYFKHGRELQIYDFDDKSLTDFDTHGHLPWRINSDASWLLSYEEFQCSRGKELYLSNLKTNEVHNIVLDTFQLSSCHVVGNDGKLAYKKYYQVEDTTYVVSIDGSRTAIPGKAKPNFDGSLFLTTLKQDKCTYIYDINDNSMSFVDSFCYRNYKQYSWFTNSKIVRVDDNNLINRNLYFTDITTQEEEKITIKSGYNIRVSESMILAENSNFENIYSILFEGIDIFTDYSLVYQDGDSIVVKRNRSTRFRWGVFNKNNDKLLTSAPYRYGLGNIYIIDKDGNYSFLKLDKHYTPLKWN